MASSSSNDGGGTGGAARPVIVDAYTHYAPKALAQYLEECSGKPLVFAKVMVRPTCL